MSHKHNKNNVLIRFPKWPSDASGSTISNRAMVRYLYFMIFTTIFLISSGCINWKAKFMQSQHELDKCQTARVKEKVSTEEEIFKWLDDRIEPDTFYVDNSQPITVPENKIDTIYHDKIPSFQNRRQYVRGSDSLKVYLTVENHLWENQFIQRVHLDSVKYQKTIITREKTVPVYVDKTNYWKPLAIAIIIATLILIIGFFAILYSRRKP